MRLFHVLRSMVSGLCVYVLASACAATNHYGSLAYEADGGPARDATADVSVVDTIRDAIADVVDEISNPVPDAKAGPTDPDVAVEPCTTVLQYSGVDSYFAVHAYPGKTRLDLAAVQALVGSNLVAGYADEVGAGAFVRDGSAAVWCGYVSNGATTNTVTFVLPAK